MAKQEGGRSVLVTVGTTKFDDLIQAVDSVEFLQALKQRGYSKLVVQKGNGTYIPQVITGAAASSAGFQVQVFEYTPSLAELIQQSSLIISHAGSGSIFETLTAGKPLIVVPNPKLMDNHQAELGDQLAAMKHLVCATPAGLLDAVKHFDASQLEPYQKGDASGIVRRVDQLMGVA